MNVGTYRLTNPRRLVRGVIIFGLAAGLSIVGVSNSVATNAEPVELVYVTVGQGDSLWAMAERHADGDPRDWIAEVVVLNALTSIELTPGQQIALP